MYHRTCYGVRNRDHLIFAWIFVICVEYPKSHNHNHVALIYMVTLFCIINSIIFCCMDIICLCDMLYHLIMIMLSLSFPRMLRSCSKPRERSTTCWLLLSWSSWVFVVLCRVLPFYCIFLLICNWYPISLFLTIEFGHGLRISYYQILPSFWYCIPFFFPSNLHLYTYICAFLFPFRWCF